jgi:Putative zinc-finger/WD40-like Beta Propeller Repeat
MKCEQVKELLSAYLDTALASEEQNAVAIHLETCRECSEVLADFRRFDTLLFQIPRVSPSIDLYERIFSSPEYLELTGTSGMSARSSRPTVPYKRIPPGITQRPNLVALPGGRSKRYVSTPSSDSRDFANVHTRGQHIAWGLRVMQIVIAATVLLTLGVGGLIGWNLWQRQTTVAQDTNGFTPPAGLQAGPIPAGTRFLFLRSGALWSAPTDGTKGSVRLTPTNTSVALNWAVRPALAGHAAGNLVAYIDLQQGFAHLIRSDGQNDIVLPQALLKASVQSQWSSATGTAILNSLAWSKDGSMLAFIADPKGSGQLGLYIYTLSTGGVQQVTLPGAAAVSRPVWSPDSIRMVFEAKLNGKTGILDYNTQNHGVLTLSADINAQGNAGDTLLSLDWSPNANTPIVTWSVGSTGHVHSIWTQRVGVVGTAGAVLLASGNYTQADYNQNAHNGVGSWLLVTANANVPGDIISVDLAATVTKVTAGKQVSMAQWSPDGVYIDYFEALSSGSGAFHLVTTSTGTDSTIATNVAIDPAPAWSADSQHLAYSAGTHVFVVAPHTSGTAQLLKQQSSATALNWSVTSPSQLVIVSNSSNGGIYLVDTQHDTSLPVDKEGIQGSIQWTQIP